MRAALVAACASLAALGCATIPPCPARGGPAWTQWESTHFVVLTDLERDDALEAVRGFEDMRQAVLLAAWRHAPPPPGRLGVIVLRDDAELRAFLPSQAAGVFAWGGPLHPFIVKAGPEADHVVTHELVHALAFSYGLLNKAEWLDEGLARYLEGMRLDDDRTLTYGTINASFFNAAARHGYLTSFENLWHEPTPEKQLAFSATSWITVHYLFNHEPTRFAEFQRNLMMNVEPRAAWRAAFPLMDIAALDKRLSAYVFREGEFAAFVTKLPPVPPDVTATPLQDADVHAVRALLFAKAGGNADAQKVRAEVAEALRLDPLEPLALYVQRAWLHESVADLEAPRKLIARRPDDALAWVLLSLAREARHEPREAAEAREQLARVQGAPGPNPNVSLDLRLARPD